MEPELVLPVAKMTSDYVTGLNEGTVMNDIILVESGADGVTDPFLENARSHFADAGNRYKLHEPESS